MLSRDRLLEILGPDCDLNDRELKELARQFHTLAELVVDLASDTLSATTVHEDTPSVDHRAEAN